MTTSASTPVWRVPTVLVRRVPFVLVCAFSVAVAFGQLSGQEAAEAIEPDSTAAFIPVTPSTAFLRAVLLPGWGHTSIGSHTRAGFYFTLEATTVYGLLRTRKRLNEVNARAEFRENALREDLAAQGITDFEEIESALDSDATLEDMRDLADSRRQQREDWAALGIFLLLLSGADAYVSAHLQNFPAPLEMQAAPAGDGRVEVGFRIKVGR